MSMHVRLAVLVLYPDSQCYLVEDYEEEFGKFLPDVEIRPYIKAKAQRQEALHELWAIAGESADAYTALIWF
jgi:hypothetical protein